MFFRGWLLLPWIAPVLVTALTWRWMFDQTGGVINYGAHRARHRPHAACLACHQVAGALFADRGQRLARLPIFRRDAALAGLQAIPTEMYEAAEIDWASVWQRIRAITLPWLEPAMLVVIILSTIWTFNDFTLVWILTQGGPSYSTHLFATYAFYIAFREENEPRLRRRRFICCDPAC